VFAAGGPGVG
jgi:hypothetical protein